MNRNNASALPNANLDPVDVMVVQWAFEARERDELTINEGDQLLLLSAGGVNEWVPARRLSGPQANISDVPSGLVPLPYLKKLEPRCRGSALYAYEAENKNCISMRVGWKLDIYLTLGKWMLVKLDRLNGKPGGLGYVPVNYVNIFDEGEEEIFRPSALKEPPREYCYLCENSIRHTTYFECTQCRLPNGDPFYVCNDCAYRRQALFVHQSVRGANHLFSRGTLWGGQWSCDECGESVNGSASFTCLACHLLTGDCFDLCNRCHNDSNVPRHKHHMTPVSAEGKLLESQASIPIPPNYGASICDGCRQDIPRFVLDCKICPNAGYRLCMDCAEFDKATFLHDRWTSGVPHEFRVGDRESRTRAQLPTRRAP